MNWKEQFKGEFASGEFLGTGITRISTVEKFIETEIIEKLIEEMPEHCDYFVGERPTLTRIKQQLRAKWLGND